MAKFKHTRREIKEALETIGALVLLPFLWPYPICVLLAKKGWRAVLRDSI